MLIKILVSVQIIILVFVIILIPSKVFAAHATVDLGTAEDFAILAGSAISDTGTTTIIGDVGLSPTTGAAITGLLTTEVTGTIYAVDSAGPAGSAGNNPGLLTLAKNDLTTAYNDAAGRTTTATVATNLGGTTLTDGTYIAASNTFSITGGQTLTLDGEGNADAVFIFKMGTTLVTGSSSSVVLVNGAQACNVFWQVGSSATLGTSTTMVGNIMADQSITDDGGSTVEGRLMASVAAVTLNNTTVTAADCAAVPTPTPTSSAIGSVNSAVGSSTEFCPVLNTQVVSPIIVESRRVDSDSVFIAWAPYSGVNTFNVSYGTENGSFLYNTDVTGFSTTINSLPLNQPVWVRIAARSVCTIGNYGVSKLVGGPMLPKTGFLNKDEYTP